MLSIPFYFIWFRSDSEQKVANRQEKQKAKTFFEHNEQYSRIDVSLLFEYSIADDRDLRLKA